MKRTYIVPLGPAALRHLRLRTGTALDAGRMHCACLRTQHRNKDAGAHGRGEKRIALAESKWSYAPDLSVSNSSSLATGRVLDETTYEFVENETVAGNSSSLGANILLFGGLKNYYNLKRAQLDLRSSLLAVEKMRNDVRMNVTAYYLEVLCAEETIRDAEQVVAELRIQEEKTAKKVEARKVTTADLLQIRSQLADAENDVLTARNTYDIARLDLCQLLEIDDYTTFRTVAPDVGGAGSFRHRGQSRGSVRRRAGIARTGGGARGGRHGPTRPADRTHGLLADALALGRVRVELFRCTAEDVPESPTAPIGMRPIRFSSSTRTMRAAMCRCRSASRFSEGSRSARTCSGRSSPYGRPNTPCVPPKNRWRRRLRRRSSTPRTAWERYRGAQRYVASAEEAARQIERKYDLGAATVTDYNAAVSAAVKARSQRLQAKYEYLFKIKTLTYYTNYDYGE